MNIKHAFIATATVIGMANGIAKAQEPAANENTVRIDCGRVPTLTRVLQVVDGKEITVYSGLNTLNIFEDEKALCYSSSSGKNYTFDNSVLDERENKIINDYKNEIVYVANAVCPPMNPSNPQIINVREITISKDVAKLANKLANIFPN